MISVFERNEKKCVIDLSTADRLASAFSEYMERDDYCSNNEGYCVNGIYFDTEDFKVARYSLSKPYYKEKLRMRCNELPTDNGSPVFLEIKKKIDKVGTKRRVLLSCGEAQAFINERRMPTGKDALTEQILSEMLYYLDRTGVSPSVFIKCRRIAMCGKQDKSLRITLDYDIMSRYDHVTFSNGGKCDRLLPENKALLEIKFSSALPLWIVRLMSEENICFSGFSKFGSAYDKYGRKLSVNMKGNTFNAGII